MLRRIARLRGRHGGDVVTREAWPTTTSQLFASTSVGRYWRRLGKEDAHRCTLADLARDVNPSADGLHERPHDPQAETKSVEASIGLSRVTGAPLEKAPQHFARDPRAIIADDHDVTARPSLEADVDGAVRSVMHGVSEQVREHSLDGLSMGAHGRRMRRAQLHSALGLMQEPSVVGDTIP